MDAQPQNERDAAGGTPVEVFISYAPEDEALLRQLETHLSKLKRQGVISTWYDRQIVAGMDWAHAIDTHLEEARVILLLISADFLGSEYCYSREMRYALERHEAGCDSTQFLSSRLTHNLSSDWLLPPLCDNRAI